MRRESSGGLLSRCRVHGLLPRWSDLAPLFHFISACLRQGNSESRTPVPSVPFWCSLKGSCPNLTCTLVPGVRRRWPLYRHRGSFVTHVEHQGADRTLLGAEHNPKCCGSSHGTAYQRQALACCRSGRTSQVRILLRFSCCPCWRRAGWPKLVRLSGRGLACDQRTAWASEARVGGHRAASKRFKLLSKGCTCFESRWLAHLCTQRHEPACVSSRRPPSARHNCRSEATVVRER